MGLALALKLVQERACRIGLSHPNRKCKRRVFHDLLSLSLFSAQGTRVTHLPPASHWAVSSRAAFKRSSSSPKAPQHSDRARTTLAHREPRTQRKPRLSARYPASRPSACVRDAMRLPGRRSRTKMAVQDSGGASGPPEGLLLRFDVLVQAEKVGWIVRGF